MGGLLCGFPMNGIPQGEYEPVIQLQTPQRYQIGTLGVQYKGLKHFTISSEFVFSNLNQNLFSNRDSNSQIGIAYHLLLQYKDELFKHKEESKRWIFNSLLGYEVRSARFYFWRRIVILNLIRITILMIRLHETKLLRWEPLIFLYPIKEMDQCNGSRNCFKFKNNFGIAQRVEYQSEMESTSFDFSDFSPPQS